MCDFCRGAPGDHDRPYRFGDLRATVMRLSKAERRRLLLLKQTVFDVRNGYEFGPAFGDIAPDTQDDAHAA
jgi:hypothetical protein